MDYFVPNFGKDQDVLDSADSIKEAEQTLGHEWKPKQDANGYWLVPEAAAATSYSYDAAVAAHTEGQRYVKK